ncbi:hypothetical protein FBU59_002297 [Linderina macrospora]|uniref:Uncharacterized protein n=1 Tax=Linderina macrospora TaxID=4868 RepID=A0ACC1JBW4_9FUNG|nr:hypothetical protein FBU59_002297 [Linderina macrospora]
MAIKALLLAAATLAATFVSGTPVDTQFFSPDDAAPYALFDSPKADSLLSTLQQELASHNASSALLASPFDNSSYKVSTTTKDNLVKYARYAGAAYKVSSKRWTCLVNCWAPETLGTEVDYHWDVFSPAAYGFVAHRSSSKEIIVSFRGSTVLMDWIQDFSFLPVAWPKSIEGSKVHNGFLSGYTSAADGIKKTLQDLTAKYPDYKIVVTGHSLGGAVATVATTDLLISHPEWKSKMELYTYGEPRVGNPVFANWLSSQNIPIFRVVNRGDMVPQVPTRWMGFEHHTQEVWYSSSSKDPVFCGGESLENDKCQNSLSPIQLSIINHLQYPGLSPSLLYWAIGQVDSII